jgi:hypothetical protein
VTGSLHDKSEQRSCCRHRRLQRDRPIEVDYFGTLLEENLYKPVETAAISGAIKPITADKVASDIVRAIERRRFAVYSDPGIAVLSGLGPLLAPVVRRFIDRRVRSAR